jgi:hypothetical protein
MQTLFQSIQNRRRGLGPLPGTDIRIRRRLLGREILLETTQHVNHLFELLIYPLKCPVLGPSRGP